MRRRPWAYPRDLWWHVFNAWARLERTLHTNTPAPPE